MTSSTSNAKVAPETAAAKPIDIHQTQSSQLYVHLHPILLISILAFSFKTLVQDPVSTLLGLAPIAAILQTLYCVLCIPTPDQTSAPPSKPGQKKKPAKQAQDIWAKVVPAILSLLLTIFLSAPTLYIILILFGAPFTTHHPHTLLLALHFALLTTPQLYYAHGLDTKAWLHIVSLQIPIDDPFGMSLGACLGAWIGAIPIPLDWDREWQKWPVTVVVGMYGGAVLGKVVGGLLFKGSKIKIS